MSAFNIIFCLFVEMFRIFIGHVQAHFVWQPLCNQLDVIAPNFMLLHFPSVFFCFVRFICQYRLPNFFFSICSSFLCERERRKRDVPEESDDVEWKNVPNKKVYEMGWVHEMILRVNITVFSRDLPVYLVWLLCVVVIFF